MEVQTRCVYIDNTFIKTSCDKFIDGFGFCEEHIKKSDKPRYDKLCMRVLHHCCYRNDINLIDECISHYQMMQSDIDEVISTHNLSYDCKNLFHTMLLSTKYFPAVNNYQSFVSVNQNKVIWWTDKSIKSLILYKRFLIKIIISSISKEFTGFIDLLPRFLDPKVLSY